MFWITIVLLVIAAYLLGSIPTAVWIGKRFYGTDIREHGSGNAGATNTFRVLGAKAGVVVFLIDFAKGFAAVSLSALSGLDAGSSYMYGIKLLLLLAVFIGHVFPVFAGFRGGKGVATIAGGMLAVYPPAVALCLVTFFIVLVLTHYVSLSSMVSGLMLPLYTVFVFGQTDPVLITTCCVVAAGLVVTHRKNISRLVKGTENRTYLRRRK